MGTAKATILESISKGRHLRGLPSRHRKNQVSQRLEKLREMASAMMDEAEALDREHSLAAASSAPQTLDLKSGIDFNEEVRRFEIELITLALRHAGGNQAQAARLLGLGTTTLNYKIKVYELL